MAINSHICSVVLQALLDIYLSESVEETAKHAIVSFLFSPY